MQNKAERADSDGHVQRLSEFPSETSSWSGVTASHTSLLHYQKGDPSNEAH